VQLSFGRIAQLMSDKYKTWSINKWITMIDDGDEAITFDVGNMSLSLLAVDVPKVHAALQEWMIDHLGKGYSGVPQSTPQPQSAIIER